MPGGEEDNATTSSSLLLAKHWGRVYETDASARTREWHCDYAACRPFIARYCEAAAHQEGTVLDVGCGGSSFGEELRQDFGLGHLYLTDIDPGIVEILRKRYSETRSPVTHSVSVNSKPVSVKCEVVDCTSMKSIPDNSIEIVVDKGTLDALHGDCDKLATLRECGRVLSINGIIISVSFASATRMPLLIKAAKMLNLRLRIKVLGKGDPKFGNTVYFVAVIGGDLGMGSDLGMELGTDLGTDDVALGTDDVALGTSVNPSIIPYASDDELTQKVLRRVHFANSVIEDEPPSVEDELTLFDESDEGE